MMALIDGLERYIEARQEPLAEAVRESVQERIKAGQFKRLEWPRAIDGQTSHPLTDGTGRLLDSFKTSTNGLHAIVGSTMPGAAVLHYGTEGRGGTKPDLFPVKAKAMRFEVYPVEDIDSPEGRRIGYREEDGKVFLYRKVCAIVARPFMRLTQSDAPRLAAALV